MSELEGTRADSSRAGLDIAFLLLLLQAGIAFLTAIGAIFLLVLAPGFRLIGVTSGLQLLIAVGLLLLASGVLRARHWAYLWTLRLEVLVLAGSCLTLFFQFGMSLTLSFLVADLVLPATILALVASRREIFRRRYT